MSYLIQPITSHLNLHKLFDYLSDFMWFWYTSVCDEDACLRRSFSHYNAAVTRIEIAPNKEGRVHVEFANSISHLAMSGDPQLIPKGVGGGLVWAMRTVHLPSKNRFISLFDRKITSVIDHRSATTSYEFPTTCVIPILVRSQEGTLA